MILPFLTAGLAFTAHSPLLKVAPWAIGWRLKFYFPEAIRDRYRVTAPLPQVKPGFQTTTRVNIYSIKFAPCHASLHADLSLACVHWFAVEHDTGADLFDP